MEEKLNWKTDAEDLKKRTDEAETQIKLGNSEGFAQLRGVKNEVDKGDIREQAEAEEKWRNSPEGIEERIKELQTRLGKETYGKENKMTIANQLEKLYDQAKADPKFQELLAKRIEKVLTECSEYLEKGKKLAETDEGYFREIVRSNVTDIGNKLANVITGSNLHSKRSENLSKKMQKLFDEKLPMDTILNDYTKIIEIFNDVTNQYIDELKKEPDSLFA